MRFKARLTKLEAQRRDGPDPGLSGLLSWAETHQPSEHWWQELGQIFTDSPYLPQLQGQPGLAELLAEARQWQEAHPR